MAEDNDLERLGKILDRAIETRNFEIQQLSSRNNFSLVVQGILFAAIFKNNLNTYGSPIALISCLGIIFSVVQIHMAAGAKFWQIRWELAAADAEKRYLKALVDKDRISLFSNSLVEVRKSVQDDLGRRPERLSPGRWRLSIFDRFEDWLICRKFSPSRGPIRIALGLLVVWVVLLFRSVW